MNKLWLCVIVNFIPLFYGFAQKDYIEVDSKILDQTRRIKVQLPRNYNPEEKKTYPLIFVFDGDYLFEPVAGVVDYLSYWEEIPEAFVIGINQVKQRIEDGNYDKINYVPVGTGAQFFDFIQFEILPYLKDNYNLGEFSVAVGHDYMANFMNLFLFSDKNPFQGYINLSPDIADGLLPYIKNELENSKSKIWYSVTTGSEDVESLKKKAKSINLSLSPIIEKNLSFSYKSFEETNHYTFVNYAIPYSLSEIFEPYTPIDEVEYQSKLSEAQNPVDYLEKKYNVINSLYDLDKTVRIDDIMQVAKAIEENKTPELYNDLSKLSKKHHPEKLLFDFFKGKYYQEIGKPKKAIKAYENAYAYDEAGGITKEMLLDEADRLKDLFGY